MPSDNSWLNMSKPMVNFSMLTNDNQFFNQVVSIYGCVKEGSVDPAGTKVTIETSDHQSLVIKLQEPLDQLLTNFVEFICRVGKGGRELECLNYVPISNEMTKEFDFDQFNSMVEVTYKFLNTVETGTNGI